MKTGDILLSQYKIAKEIGLGGMGMTFLAKDNGLFGDVVVKTMLPHLESENELFRRFQREIRILSQLSHQNIIKILCADFDHDPPFYVMEFCHGGTLLEASADKELGEIFKLMLQAMQGIRQAHESGVLHRDIKPANLLVDKNGVVKVADFGLGRFSDRDSTTLTSSKVGLGTPAYMAPEQFVDAKNIDERADIFSMGILFRELLIGQTPYKTSTKFSDIVAERFPELSEDDIMRLVRLINTATERDKNDRFGSMDELISELKRIMKHRDAVKTSRGLLTPETYAEIVRNITFIDFRDIHNVKNGDVSTFDFLDVYNNLEFEDDAETETERIESLFKRKLLSGHFTVYGAEPGIYHDVVPTKLGAIVHAMLKGICENMAEVEKICQWLTSLDNSNNDIK